VHPFAAGLEPQPEPEPVNLIAVRFGFIQSRIFEFDRNFTTLPFGLDPAFEARVPLGPWLVPTSMGGPGATTVTYTFGTPAQPVQEFRILTPPTLMSWAPRALTIPITGPIPYP
jgi:hypothetical protein